MRRIGDSNVCPYCNNEKAEPQQAPFLPLKTVVGGKYLVGKLAATNGEGNTYYAFDLERKCPVTLNEFFPAEMVSRGADNYCLVNVGKAAAFIEAKSDFLKLWNALKPIKGYSALSTVFEVFEELGTVYSVTEYLGEGKTLRETLLETEQGYVSWEEARVLLMPVLSGLAALHAAGICHCGISPMTLIVDKDGKVKLSGFNTLNVRRNGSVLESELFDGYAAIEQYGGDTSCGAWTDIYAFAAVLYRTLIGSTPINASSRILNDKLMIPGKFAEKLPAYVINALVNALQIMPDDRTRTVENLRDELSASPKAVNAAQAYSDTVEQQRVAAAPHITAPLPQIEEPEDEDEEPTGKIKKSTIAALIISLLLCACILVGVFYILNGGSFRKNNGEPASTSESVSDTQNTSETEKVTHAPAVSDEFISLSLPDFTGKPFEEIKKDEKYKKVFDFETEYVDSDKPRGTVIAQSLPEGTNVNSMSKRSIKFTVSNGLEVPDVIGMNIDEALEKLSKTGFTNIDPEQSKVPNSVSQSHIVYGVVYLDVEKDDWTPLPGDRRLSANEKIIVYYYSEFMQSGPETSAPAETAATTASAGQ